MYNTIKGIVKIVELDQSTTIIKAIKGILWQFYKLGLKVPSGRDKNNGISHFAKLGSSWAGQLKMCPKISLCIQGRMGPSVLEHGTFLPPVPQHSTFIAPPVPQHTIFRPSSNA